MRSIPDPRLEYTGDFYSFMYIFGLFHSYNSKVFMGDIDLQEHIGSFIIKLLAPPVPVDYSGSESHLIVYAPMLNVLLVGISSIDCVQIISLHGLVSKLWFVLLILMYH